MSLKQKLLNSAEVFDAWRIFPRIFVIIYGIMIIQLGLWFAKFELQPKKECNVDLFKHLTDVVKVNAQEAHQLACTTVDMVGGPTTEHTVYVTAICGLATAIFAFYVNSKRSWKTTPPNSKTQYEEIGE